MKVLVIGSGKMAQGIIYDLLQNIKLEKLILIDQSEKALQEMQKRFNNTKLQSYKIFADDINSLRPLFEQADGVISAVPYDYNLALTKLAIETGSHFVDLGGNNSVVEKQFALDPQAKEQGIGVVPDCGLAPGMVSIVTAHAI
ncbi:MAG: saccharopine dehydrogenase NADP-binding domain-containing protein, partial [Calditrichales bacterium]|nr:saccharopine dehydrogenase NADP-binding domain-containing protein [Calditrichales bacterium]